jgi:hypothetical protein
MGRRPTEQGDPISIRLKASLVEHLTEAANQLDLSLHDTMRQCMKIGLADLKAINYDIASTISNAAHRPDLDHAPETPTPYSATGKQNRAG